jgi:hypothetical protein
MMARTRWRAVWRKDRAAKKVVFKHAAGGVSARDHLHYSGLGGVVVVLCTFSFWTKVSVCKRSHALLRSKKVPKHSGLAHGNPVVQWPGAY